MTCAACERRRAWLSKWSKIAADRAAQAFKGKNEKTNNVAAKNTKP